MSVWVISCPTHQAPGRPMSALPPIATRMLQRRDWSLSANSDISRRSKQSLFDHLVGAPSRVGGKVRPSALAVLRLIMN